MLPNSKLNDRFGQNLLFSPDGTSLIVAESSGTFNTINNAGTVEIFKIVTPANGWESVQVIGSQVPGSFNGFGSSISISNDGNTLVIGEPSRDQNNMSNAGAVDIYTNNLGAWQFLLVITSQTPKSGNGFGNRLTINSDSSSIAISESNGSNTVQIFNKSGASWAYSQTLDTQRNTTTGFGSSIKFNPDGSILAVGDLLANANTGVVQLFTKIGNTWIIGQELSSSTPGELNYFGNALRLSGNITIRVRWRPVWKFYRF